MDENELAFSVVILLYERGHSLSATSLLYKLRRRGHHKL